MEEFQSATAKLSWCSFRSRCTMRCTLTRAGEAARILVPGGRISCSIFCGTAFEEARELYADEWLGFSEAELESMLQNAAS